MGEEIPSSGWSVPGVRSGRWGRKERRSRGTRRQPALIVGAPAQAASRVTVVVLHDDLLQRLDTGPERVAPPVRAEMFQ